MIILPPKIWRPKFISKYKTPNYADDIDDGVFDYAGFCHCVFRPDLSWEDAERNDLIKFINDSDTEKLEKYLRICKNVDNPTRNDITQIVQKYWDCFCKEFFRQKHLVYEFGIDTGDSKPVCCKKPAYVPYESKIIMDQFQQLLANGWAKRCKRQWGSLIVLAYKPHQEHVTNICDFIWRMCVSYRKLNGLTKPFQYPIPLCDDAFTVLNVGSHWICIIALDDHQGYHQVVVRPADQEN